MRINFNINKYKKLKNNNLHNQLLVSKYLHFLFIQILLYLINISRYKR